MLIKRALGEGNVILWLRNQIQFACFFQYFNKLAAGTIQASSLRVKGLREMEVNNHLPFYPCLNLLTRYVEQLCSF